MNPPVAPDRRRTTVRRVATVVGFAIVVWFVATRLGTQWTEFRATAATVRPRWGLVVLSAAVVLATYGLLIQSWRVLVRAWGGALSFVTAARIWTVSNLGRYVPGTLWSIGAMGVLAQRAGVPPAAAAGAAVLGTLLNLATGCVVFAAAGGDFAARLAPGAPHPRLLTAAVGVVLAVALPVAIPAAAGLAARVLRRERPARLPLRVLAAALAANLLAWVGYGLAFGGLAHALLPSAGGDWVGYVAVFAGSYLAGYMAFLLPAGLGVREGAMVVALTHLGLASVVDATLLAVASRLWLTVLELAPGLAFLAHGVVRRPPGNPLRRRPDVPA